jgi:hypothetical protein
MLRAFCSQVHSISKFRFIGSSGKPPLDFFFPRTLGSQSSRHEKEPSGWSVILPATLRGVVSALGLQSEGWQSQQYQIDVVWRLRFFGRFRLHSCNISMLLCRYVSRYPSAGASVFVICRKWAPNDLYRCEILEHSHPSLGFLKRR